MTKLGGVEAAGRVAWEALSQGRNRKLFCYDTDRPASPLAKLNAITTAFSLESDVRVVLIWHLGLLKLLPFFRTGRARVAVTLLGVEAWKRHDRLTAHLLKRADLLLSITDFTWRRYLEFYPEQSNARHRTVHLGLGMPVFGPSPAPDAVPAALMLGRMSSNERYKGHDEVIAAWPSVMARVPGARLWIAGPGDYREHLERKARHLRVGDTIQFLGQISEEEKEERLRRARALVLPSRGEGFGLVYLEAMRQGRPCLVGANDAGLEVVHPPDAGLAVNPLCQDELTDALARLLSAGPAWDRWSVQARARYESLFTEEHFQKRLVEALGDLL
jgi:phosphatidylinositol alpha-1,6-mannosyltransferase